MPAAQCASAADGRVPAPPPATAVPHLTGAAGQDPQPAKRRPAAAVTPTAGAPAAPPVPSVPPAAAAAGGPVSLLLRARACQPQQDTSQHQYEQCTGGRGTRFTPDRPQGQEQRPAEHPGSYAQQDRADEGERQVGAGAHYAGPGAAGLRLEQLEAQIGRASCRGTAENT